MRVRSMLAFAAAVSALAFAGQASAANLTVWAGPGFLKVPPAGAPKMAAANLFFPQRVVVHVGDSVTFKSREFHTATYLGSHKASEFQAFVPAADKSTYTFKKPGTYTFRCLIHPMMTARVVVKPASAAVTSTSQILKANAAELASAIATAKKLDAVTPGDANTVYAGVGKQVGGGSIELMAFKPQKLAVKVGTTVTFKLSSPMEPHNMVFGPEAYLKQSFKTLDLVPQGPGKPNQVWPFFFYGSDPAQGGVYT